MYFLTNMYTCFIYNQFFLLLFFYFVCVFGSCKRNKNVRNINKKKIRHEMKPKVGQINFFLKSLWYFLLLLLLFVNVFFFNSLIIQSLQLYIYIIFRFYFMFFYLNFFFLKRFSIYLFISPNWCLLGVYRVANIIKHNNKKRTR